MWAVALAVALSAPAVAQSPSDAEGAAGVALRQLEAFRADDFDTAYTFASKAIRAMFDRERFEVMVRAGYPEIARPISATVERTEAAPAGGVYVLLRVHGANGRAVLAIYEMVLEEGRFRINGVVTQPEREEPERRT